MALKSILRRPSRVFYGWKVVAVSGLIHGLGSALSTQGFSVIFLPITREFGISRAATSLVYSLSQVEGSVLNIVYGWFIDRLGPRLVLAVGIAIAGVGYLLLSQVNSYWVFLLVYIGIISLGLRAGGLLTLLAVVNNWFRRHRALAMSTVYACSGLGAVVVPLYSAVVLNYGWRVGVTVTGLGFLVIMLPIAFIIRSSPEGMGLMPDGDSAEPSQTSVAGRRGSRSLPKEVDFTVKEAMRTRAYWMMMFAQASRFFGRAALSLHFIPIMVWKGLEPQQAAYILGLQLFWYIPSGPLGGWLADRFSKPKVLAISTWLWTLSPLIFLYSQAPWQLWTGATIFGLMEGFAPAHHALVGDYFGRKNYATLRGVMVSFASVSTIIGPFLAGLLYDRYQSYQWLLFLSAAAFLAGGTLYFLLRAPRPSRRVDATVR